MIRTASSGFSLPMVTCIQSSFNPVGNRYNMAQREERTHPDDNDACWSLLGAGLRIQSSLAHFAPQKSTSERFSELKRRRTRAGRVEIQGYLRPCRLQQRWLLHLGRKVDEGDSLDPGDNGPTHFWTRGIECSKELGG